MTTHAIRLHQPGGPEVLKWESVELGAPGPGQLRVKHGAVGLNYIDVYHRNGHYPLQYPSGIGMEAAGVVDAVGPDVTGLAPGDRVAYASGPLGAYAEARLMPADRVVKLPDAIGDDQAAAMMLQGMTAHYLCVSTYAVQAGDDVLILAAAGGVGLLLIQMVKARGGRVIAVTAKPDAAVAAGIDETRVLQFSEGVGGRYSLWSAVGLTAALGLGWSEFEELLEGAAEMDRHFRYTEVVRNLPLIAAFVDRIYVRKFGSQTRGVFAYDERLRLVPFYLQQLEMESNGKSVKLDGTPVDGPSAPVTWGGTGTDAQHAVFQLLHQGTVLVPVEFLAVTEAEDSLPQEHHRQLLLNAFAQGAALMAGRESDDPHRSYPGNRPSTTILLERLDARALGGLLAFYEHRTFANAVLMGINPFDQFGVELGKQIANELAEGEGEMDLDASTRALMEKSGL